MITDPKQIASIFNLLRGQADKRHCINPDQLNDDALMALIQAGEEVKVKGRGQTIFREGTHINFLAIVIIGVVFRFRKMGLDKKGREKCMALEFAVCGNPMGDESMLGQGPVSLTHRTLNTVRYLKIDSTQVQRIMHQQREVTDWLHESCHANTMSILHGFLTPGSGNALQKLVAKLLHIASLHGLPDQDGIFIPFRLTHKDLAQIIGGSRPETITRKLQEIRAENLIFTRREGIVIKDPERLRRFARLAAA